MSLTVCKDEFASCGKLKAQLDASNGSCYTTDVGEATSNPAYDGLHLADKCCGTCQPGCSRCLAAGHSRSFCDSILVCHASATCSLPKICTTCLVRATKAECESYGVDCTETCSAAPSGSRRRAQGGAAAAVQVQAGGQSSKQLSAILNCLAEGDSVAKCAGNASAA